jgi:hypothetical protein
LDPVAARSFVSRQLGLEARKIHAKNAIKVFNKHEDAVGKYNTAIIALEAEAGRQFLSYGLKSEIELLDLQHPFASNTDLIFNAILGAPLFRESLYMEPNSSIPDVQQQVMICRQAMPSRERAKRTKKTKKGKK